MHLGDVARLSPLSEAGCLWGVRLLAKTRMSIGGFLFMYRLYDFKLAIFCVPFDCFVSFLSIVRVVAPPTIKGECNEPAGPFATRAELGVPRGYMD